nr:MAG TPA: hypothetical protein [Caudoviricetes sp.]DAX33135.1 MAG TPA: hypothetical protein [Caudoviricetes sp.]
MHRSFRWPFFVNGLFDNFVKKSFLFGDEDE